MAVGSRVAVGAPSAICVGTGVGELCRAVPGADVGRAPGAVGVNAAAAGNDDGIDAGGKPSAALVAVAVAMLVFAPFALKYCLTSKDPVTALRRRARLLAPTMIA